MTQIRHFESELVELKQSLVSMGALVERSLDLAVSSLLRPNLQARGEIMLIEESIDSLETTIEERCHTMMALQAPMARDLRLLVAVTRITADLEEIGDLTESIAKRAHYIAKHHAIENPHNLGDLTVLAKTMVHQSLDSFIALDTATASRILIEEDEADRQTKVCYKAMQLSMQERPDLIKEFTHLLRATGHLEHIADIAVSIAEEVVYIHRGQLLRHPHLIAPPERNPTGT